MRIVVLAYDAAGSCIATLLRVTCGITLQPISAHPFCMGCQQNGLSLHDQQSYFCSGCGNKYGHMKFGRDALKNHKSKRTALSCKRCNAAAEEEVKLENARARALVAQLRRTEAWRCTCRKIPRGQRAHAALNNNVHAERCQLFHAGERRWDGKNVGIELDDLRFLSPRCIY